MDEWLTRARDVLAAVSDVPASELDLSDDAVVTLLELAALAAHESGERTNAPLLCYLLGKAEQGAEPEALVTAVRETS
jgi:hypothetical protein